MKNCWRHFNLNLLIFLLLAASCHHSGDCIAIAPSAAKLVGLLSMEPTTGTAPAEVQAKFNITSSQVFHQNHGGDDDGPSHPLLMAEWAYDISAAYLVLVTFLGLAMNLTIVVVILSDHRQRSPLHWMLLNLAISDGCIAGFGTPVSAVAAFQKGWHFSHELCLVYALVMSTTGIGSMITLAVLALWRFTLVACFSPNRPRWITNLTAHHQQTFAAATPSNDEGLSSGAGRGGPSRYRPRPNGGAGGSGAGGAGVCRARDALIVIFLIWLYTFGVTLPPLFGWGHYGLEGAHFSCSVNWHQQQQKLDIIESDFVSSFNGRSYIVFMFVMGLVVPLGVVVACYVCILHVLYKTNEIRKKTLTTVAQPSQGNVSSKMNARDKAEKKVTMMVVYMIGAYLVAWTPYSIMALVETFYDYSSPKDRGVFSAAMATIPSLFAKTSCVTNPLVYGLLNPLFRSACLKLWARFKPQWLGTLWRRCCPLRSDAVAQSSVNNNAAEAAGDNSAENETLTLRNHRGDARRSQYLGDDGDTAGANTVFTATATAMAVTTRFLAAPQGEGAEATSPSAEDEDYHPAKSSSSVLHDESPHCPTTTKIQRTFQFPSSSPNPAHRHQQDQSIGSSTVVVVVAIENETIPLAAAAAPPPASASS